MARNRQLTLDQAKALADRWHDMGEGLKEAWQLSSRFADAGPHRVIEMWETGRVIEDPKSKRNGKPLSKFEVQALGERWMELFGSLPPSLGNGTATPAPPPEPEPQDNTKLKLREVVRRTSLSASTIKRYVRDKKFPTPTKIGTRRIGWDASKIKAYEAKREAGLEWTAADG